MASFDWDKENMETLQVPIKIPIKNYSHRPRMALRAMSADEWVEAHASGTLRKAKRIGFAWRSLYLKERVAYEWGWEFEIVPKSHVQCGIPQVEGDSHPVTEAGWHIERYMTLNPFETDIFEPAYITVSGEEKREGIGLVLKTTDAPWIPQGHVIFAIVAELEPLTGQYMPARNPA